MARSWLSLPGVTADNGRAAVDLLGLTPEVAAEVISHAQAGFPDEVCGLIFGRHGLGWVLYRGRNVSATPRWAYELDSESLIMQLAQEDRGLELVAIYHSHPQGPSGPSPDDVAQALYAGCVYLICSLADPQQPQLRGFRIAHGEAQEVNLVLRSDLGTELT
jgi:proteasome lid subunit RPN8/RPN11